VQQLTRNRVAVAVTFLVHGIVVGNWIARVPAVRDKLALSPAFLGFSLLGAAVGALAAMPMAARLCNRFGSRAVTRVSSVLFCAVLPLPGLVTAKWLLFPALAAYGAAAGAMDVSMNTQGADVERLRGTPTMSSFHALFSIGGMIGAAAGAFAAHRNMAVQVHLGISALVLLPVVALAGLWLIPGRDQAYEGPFRLSAMRGTLLGLSVISFCILLGEGAMADWSAIYLRDVAGSAAAVAALGYSVFSAAMAIGRLCGDSLTSRVGPVGVVRYGSLLAALGLAGALIAGTSWAAMVGFGCMGFGFASIFPNMCSAAASQPRVSPAVAIAAVSTTGYLGFLVGPPLIGLIAQTQTLRVALLLVVMLSGVATMLARAAQTAVRSSPQAIKDIVRPDRHAGGY